MQVFFAGRSRRGPVPSEQTAPALRVNELIVLPLFDPIPRGVQVVSDQSPLDGVSAVLLGEWLAYP